MPYRFHTVVVVVVVIIPAIYMCVCENVCQKKRRSIGAEWKPFIIESRIATKNPSINLCKYFYALA